MTGRLATNGWSGPGLRLATRSLSKGCKKCVQALRSKRFLSKKVGDRERNHRPKQTSRPQRRTKISLTAAIGTASSDLSGLFKSGSGAWSYAPQIVMPIFDAGTWSAHRAAKVQREIAVTQYEKAIQSAFREVADALAVRGTMDQQVSAQESLVNASAETYRLATSRYDKGIDSFLSVLDAQRSLFAAQQALVFLRLEKLANQVSLYAVLGGGWEAEPSPGSAAMAGSPPAPARN